MIYSFAGFLNYFSHFICFFLSKDTNKSLMPGLFSFRTPLSLDFFRTVSNSFNVSLLVTFSTSSLRYFFFEV